MSKTFLITALLGAVAVDAKMRPIDTPFNTSDHPLVKSHERRVSNQVVKAPSTCSKHGNIVEAGHEDSPVVGAGACKTQCLFQDDQNEWCFSTTAPMLSAGWNFVQNTGKNFWQVKMMPYFETQALL